MCACVELLELRSEGERDVQWMQHGAILQFVLSAQRLGDAPSNVLCAFGRHVAGWEKTATTTTAAAVVHRNRALHGYRVVYVCGSRGRSVCSKSAGRLRSRHLRTHNRHLSYRQAVLR